MSVNDNLLITARLASPLAGDAPHLDALLEYTLSLYHPGQRPGTKQDRRLPAPAPGAIPIPIRRERLGDWLVACCSSPVLSVPETETVAHIHKRLAVEHAGLLHPEARRIVSTTDSWTKSYRLPIRLRRVPLVRWFAVGHRREVLKLLRRQVTAIGKKPSIGYGRIASWEVERVDTDHSWFAPSEAGPVLMRPLPVGPWLPEGLVGARRDFGACSSPYWHPERYGEIVVPC